MPLFVISSLEFLIESRADVTAFLSHKLSLELVSHLFFKLSRSDAYGP